MDKITQLFPAALFLVYFGKLTLTGADFADAAVLAILAVWAIAIESKLKTKETQALLQRLAESDAKVEEASKHLDTLRNQFSMFKSMRK